MKKKQECQIAFDLFFNELTELAKCPLPTEQMRRTLDLVSHFEKLYEKAYNEGEKVGRKSFRYILERN